MTIVEFIIYSLVCWRGASLLVNEIGPFDMFQNLREYYYNKPKLHLFINLDCVWCISVYIGWILAFFSIGFTWKVFFLGLAYSASAIIIESVVRYFIQADPKVLKNQTKKEN